MTLGYGLKLRGLSAMCIKLRSYTHRKTIVRTNIEIDDELLASAMAASGLRTKKAVVDQALRRLVRQEAQKRAIAEMAGLGWEGDLDAMRCDAPKLARR